jgi:hypothetical protein
LEHALAGGHLGRLVVGAVALARAALGAAAIFGVLRQPLADLRRVALEPLKALRLPGLQVGFDRLGILRAVAREVGPGAALGFRRIARQLHPVDGEHLAPDQSLAVADKQHLREHIGNVLTQRADEVRDGGEVRDVVSGQGDEGDVLSAGPLDRPARYHSLRIGEQDHLEQHRRRIGRGAGFVVAVARVEIGQIELMIEQLVQGVLEGTRQQLLA